jgi:hypothetical protein
MLIHAFASNRTIPSLVFGLYAYGHVIRRKHSKAIEVLDTAVVTKVKFESDVVIALLGQELLQGQCYRDESSKAELILRREGAHQNLAEAEPCHVVLDQPSEEANVLIYVLSAEIEFSKVSMLFIYHVRLHLFLELDMEKPDYQKVLLVCTL